MQIRKRQVYSTAAILLVVIIFLVMRRSSSKTVETQTTKSSTTQQTASVTALAIAPQTFDQKIFATGTLLANEEIDLMSEISGRITALNFREGLPVKQGQLLVKINDADLRAQLKKLELQQQLAEKEEARAKKLVQQQLLSQEEYDAVLNKLESVQADIEKLHSDIAKTEIHSPFNGIIGLRSVSTGSTVTTTTSIAKIQQINPIKIDFAVPEKYSSALRAGLPVTFTVAGSDKVYAGTVYAVEPKIDLATRTLRVRAQCPNPDGSLMPGAFAKITITLQSIPSAIAVPTASIIPQLDGQKVFVYSGGKVVSKKVTTGIRTDSTIQITQGLSIGDTLITSGLMQLKEGSPVSVTL